MTPARTIAMAVLAAALTGCASELVVLLPDDEGRVGELAMTGDSGEVVLDQAYDAARVGLAGASADRVEQAEVDAEFAAALAAAPPPPAGYVLYFEEGTTVLAPESRPTLDTLLAEVARRPGADVQVTGHTDRVGAVEDNDRLAGQRAQMVRALLLRDEGLAPELVSAVGRGEREPLVPTADEVREARNRRVEVTVR